MPVNSPDLSEVINLAKAEIHYRRLMLKRRSKGIKNILVRRKVQKLELWDVYVSNRKTDEYFTLEGKFPLTWLSNDGYEANLDLPNGQTVRVLVRYSGGWVMISTPGQSWSISCQVGKQLA